MESTSLRFQGLFLFTLRGFRRWLLTVEEWLLGCRNESTTARPVLSFTFVFEGTWCAVSDFLTLHRSKEVNRLAPRFHEELSEIEQTLVSATRLAGVLKSWGSNPLDAAGSLQREHRQAVPSLVEAAVSA